MIARFEGRTLVFSVGSYRAQILPAGNGTGRLRKTLSINPYLDLAPTPGPMTGYVIEGELLPGAETGWHTHPGNDFTYVRSGELTLEVEGKATRTYKGGTAFHNEPGVKHNGRNLSKTEPVKYLAVWVLEQGKPPTSPAPAKK
jgi:glyoxylate utilization-related uncharacterized protein